jgi:hypothetical protein
LRDRWLGATGVRVPEIAVEGEDLEVISGDRIRVDDHEVDALVLDAVGDDAALHESHLRGTPIVVRANDADQVTAALHHPEVACALVPTDRRDLRELDLRQIKYG